MARVVHGVCLSKIHSSRLAKPFKSGHPYVIVSSSWVFNNIYKCLAVCMSSCSRNMGKQISHLCVSDPGSHGMEAGCLPAPTGQSKHLWILSIRSALTGSVEGAHAENFFMIHYGHRKSGVRPSGHSAGRTVWAPQALEPASSAACRSST